MSKKKSKGKHHGRSVAEEGAREPLTAAHVAAEAEIAAECGPEGHCDAGPVTGEDARKAAIPGIEAQEGPGTFTEPGLPGPGDFSRPYLDAGHSAPSPQHQAPNVAPLPPAQPGVLTPLQMSAVPHVVGIGPVGAKRAGTSWRLSL